MNIKVLPSKVKFNKADYTALVESIKKLEDRLKDTEILSQQKQSMISQCIKNLSKVFDAENKEDIIRLFNAECDVYFQSTLTTGKDKPILKTRII